MAKEPGEPRGVDELPVDDEQFTPEQIEDAKKREQERAWRQIAIMSAVGGKKAEDIVAATGLPKKEAERIIAVAKRAQQREEDDPDHLDLQRHLNDAISDRYVDMRVSQEDASPEDIVKSMAESTGLSEDSIKRVVESTTAYKFK